MILGDADIRAAMERKDVVITPYKPSNMGPVSYDVELGEYYYTENLNLSNGLINPYTQEGVDRMWGRARRAGTLEDTLEGFPAYPPDFMGKGFSSQDRVIWLMPGATILAHTEEFIGGRNNITTRMQARSTWGRLGVGVCKCAGKGDPGYINRWTMEITSFNKHHAIPLKVGERIAQIEFMYVAHVSNQYGVKGNYQPHDSADMEQVINGWEPSMMLPRLHSQRTHGG